MKKVTIITVLATVNYQTSIRSILSFIKNKLGTLFINEEENNKLFNVLKVNRLISKEEKDLLQKEIDEKYLEDEIVIAYIELNDEVADNLSTKQYISANIYEK